MINCAAQAVGNILAIPQKRFGNKIPRVPELPHPSFSLTQFHRSTRKQFRNAINCRPGLWQVPGAQIARNFRPIHRRSNQTCFDEKHDV